VMRMMMLVATVMLMPVSGTGIAPASYSKDAGSVAAAAPCLDTGESGSDRVAAGEGGARRIGAIAGTLNRVAADEKRGLDRVPVGEGGASRFAAGSDA
jgi:hypothetical protein